MSMSGPREKPLRIRPLGRYFFENWEVRVEAFRINPETRREEILLCGVDGDGSEVWIDFEYFAATAKEFADPIAEDPSIAEAA